MVSYVRRNFTQCKPRGDEELCHEQYHYADVAIERSGYRRGEFGTSDHDVVGAIRAASAVLQGRPAPPPFDLTPKEALRLLAHLVGDIHQPLHVGAVYLDARGRRIDPDHHAAPPPTHTNGGNRLLLAHGNLHSEWDFIPEDLLVDHLDESRLAAARAVPRSHGTLNDWPVQWASESVLASRQVHEGLVVGMRSDDDKWPITEPPGYEARRVQMQARLLIEAGAHLAQVLEAIFPR
jgi:S1/P1 Nuclease